MMSITLLNLIAPKKHDVNLMSLVKLGGSFQLAARATHECLGCLTAVIKPSSTPRKHLRAGSMRRQTCVYSDCLKVDT